MRCEELVPIYHSVKFAKCEICGSTKLDIIWYSCELPHSEYKEIIISCKLPWGPGVLESWEEKIFIFRELGSTGSCFRGASS